MCNGCEVSLIQGALYSFSSFLKWFSGGQIAMVLVRSGCDVNARDNKGNYPLHYAAWSGHTSICELFVTGKTHLTKADVNAKVPIFRFWPKILSLPSRLTCALSEP